MMFPSLSTILVTLLNKVIEGNSKPDLTKLEGRSLAITIDEFPQDIAFTVKNQCLQALDEDCIHTADVTISGNIKAIVNMLHDIDTGLENDELYLTGKISTAKNFHHFLASLSLDWQSIFGRFLPQPVAKQINNTLNQGLDFSKGAIDKISEHLKSHLTDESKYFVKKNELGQLSKDIQSLHQQLDRIAKKLAGYQIKL